MNFEEAEIYLARMKSLARRIENEIQTALQNANLTSEQQKDLSIAIEKAKVAAWGVGISDLYVKYLKDEPSDFRAYLDGVVSQIKPTP